MTIPMFEEVESRPFEPMGTPEAPCRPGYQAPVNPGNAKAEMGDLRSFHHQNRSADGRLAGTIHLARFASALVNTMQQVGGSIGTSALSTIALTS